MVQSSFNTDRRVWESLSPAPYKLGDRCLLLELFGFVYLLNRSAEYNHARNLLCYDTIENKWSETAVVDANKPDCYITSVFISKNRLYASTTYRGLYRYDTVQNTWTLVNFDRRRKCHGEANTFLIAVEEI